MSENTRRCENCGEVCKITDSFCRSCYASLKTKPEEECTETVSGVSSSEWKKMFQKNEARYYEIFKSNEDKKVFVHTNWAAAFLGIFWYFYRRMYLYGILWMTMICLLFPVGFGLSTAVLHNDFTEYEKAQENIVDYDFESDGKYSVDGRIISDEEYQEIVSYRKSVRSMKDGIIFKVFGFTFGLVLVATVVSGLFADCLYRRNLLKKHALALQGVHKLTGVSNKAANVCIPFVCVIFTILSTSLVFVLARMMAKL